MALQMFYDGNALICKIEEVKLNVNIAFVCLQETSTGPP